MADGGSRAVESLKIGDLVAGGTSAVAVVTTAPSEHLRDHFCRINEDLCLTGDHPALVRTAAGTAWRRTDALVEGDRLFTASGALRIDSIRRVNLPVFTIYVETSSGSMLAGRAGFAVRSRYVSHPAGTQGRARTTTA
jgi:hypothetical protein